MKKRITSRIDLKFGFFFLFIRQVRNAAFFSLGQFAEFLQPDISKYANEILPILYEFLQSLCVEIRVIINNSFKHFLVKFFEIKKETHELQFAVFNFIRTAKPSQNQSIACSTRWKCSVRI